jgi:hypothetical protein
MPWVDRYSTKTYRITTTDPHGDRYTARVKTYGEVIEEYGYHPESKCADAKGLPSGKQTIGLLQRRHVRIDSVTPIGKESNSMRKCKPGWFTTSRMSTPNTQTRNAITGPLRWSRL